MKKYLSIIISSFIFLQSVFCVDFKFINLSQIQKINKYETELLYAINNQRQFSHWYADEYWKFDESKEECSTKLKELYNLIKKNPEPKNQEYLLTKAAISEFLYNLDKMQHEEVVKNYEAINKIKDHDYRGKWFLGLFYSQSAKPFEAIAEMQYITDRIPEEKLHPEFFYSYAYIANMAMMPATAIKYLEKYETYSGNSLENDQFVQSIKNTLKNYDGKKVELNDAFRPVFRNDKKGFFSRLTGTFISPKEDWILKKASNPDYFSYNFTFQSQNIESHNMNITYSLVSLISTFPLPDGSFADNVAKNLIEQSNATKIDLFPDNNNITAYEFIDANKYKEVGGSHGLIVTMSVNHTEDIDIKMEVPSVYQGAGNQLSFLPIQKDFKRFPGPVTYTFVLDSCEYIFEQSKTEFIDFINNCEFY